MIHFTPIQELGASNSAYSLKDQLKLNPMFQPFDKKKEYTIDDVGKLIEWMKREWGVLAITDIVLNHTANEAPWLRDHPEATYNCHNSPHMRPAYLLDRMLYHCTLDIIDGKWKEQGLDVEINIEQHLSILRRILHEEYLPKVRTE
jgi:glycogen debranching enzyme